MSSGAVRTVEQFSARVNAHDVEAIASLLTPQHCFIDSLGQRAQGRETLRAGWAAYFRMVPDYRLTADRVLHEGADVVVIGHARGTYSADGTLRAANAWWTPAAFRARVEGGLLAEWQVYADNEPMRRCMQRKV